MVAQCPGQFVRGPFWLKMADSIAILVQFFSILTLDSNSLDVERCALNRLIYNKKIEPIERIFLV